MFCCVWAGQGFEEFRLWSEPAAGWTTGANKLLDVNRQLRASCRRFDGEDQVESEQLLPGKQSLKRSTVEEV